MKSYIVFCSCFLTVACLAQNSNYLPEKNYRDYDIYVPIQRKYEPLGYSGPRQFKPFTLEEDIPSGLDDLWSFIKMAIKYPAAQDGFLLPLYRYEEIHSKWLKKNKREVLYDIINVGDVGGSTEKEGSNIKWKKGELESYKQDFRTLKHFIYKIDSLAFEEKMVAFINDSISYRKAYITDSLKVRSKFESDSLYRLQYREQHGYDYIEWSGPHGRPIKCYRDGKIIEGEEVDNWGRVLKAWKNGKLVLERKYDGMGRVLKEWEIGKAVKEREYDDEGRVLKEWENGKLIGDFEYGVSIFYGDYQKDKINKKRVYYNHNNVNDISRIEWYDNNGNVSKMQEGDEVTKYTRFSNGKTQSYNTYDLKGAIKETYKIEYASDGSGKYAETFTYYVPYPSREVIQYYSDGTINFKKEYLSYDNGKSFTVYKIRVYRGSYCNDTYYDRRGQVEREEIVTRSGVNW